MQFNKSTYLMDAKRDSVCNDDSSKDAPWKLQRQRKMHKRKASKF